MAHQHQHHPHRCLHQYDKCHWHVWKSRFPKDWDISKFPLDCSTALFLKRRFSEGGGRAGRGRQTSFCPNSDYIFVTLPCQSCFLAWNSSSLICPTRGLPRTQSPLFVYIDGRLQKQPHLRSWSFTSLTSHGLEVFQDGKSTWAKILLVVEMLTIVVTIAMVNERFPKNCKFSKPFCK